MSLDSSISLLEGYLRVYQTQRQLSYQASQEKYPIPITVFKATESNYQISDNATWDWQLYSEQNVEVYDVSGNHMSILMPPNVHSLAKTLKKCIVKAGNTINKVLK